MKVIFTPFMILSNRVAQCAINLTSILNRKNGFAVGKIVTKVAVA